MLRSRKVVESMSTADPSPDHVHIKSSPSPLVKFGHKATKQREISVRVSEGNRKSTRLTPLRLAPCKGVSTLPPTKTSVSPLDFTGIDDDNDEATRFWRAGHSCHPKDCDSLDMSHPQSVSNKSGHSIPLSMSTLDAMTPIHKA